jgi:hypothetical protein
MIWASELPRRLRLREPTTRRSTRASPG